MDMFREKKMHDEGITFSNFYWCLARCTISLLSFFMRKQNFDDESKTEYKKRVMDQQYTKGNGTLD